MYILGGVILVCVAGWYAFSAIDRVGLRGQTGTARVIGKEHQDVRRGYTTDIIGGRAQTVPRVQPEAYILKLDLGGRETATGVEKNLYDSVNPRDDVQVTYLRRRITGAVQIIRVSR